MTRPEGDGPGPRPRKEPDPLREEPVTEKSAHRLPSVTTPLHPSSLDEPYLGKTKNVMVIVGACSEQIS